MLQPADPAVADQLAGTVELRPGVLPALLRADLENPSGLLHFVRHAPPLGDGERGGLLEIDMLARLHRMDGERRVLVVGRGDQHRVDVLRGQQLAIIGMAARARIGFAGTGGIAIVDQLHAGAEPPGVDIAHRDDLRVSMLVDLLHVVDAADPADADRADGHSVRRRVRSEHARRHDHRRRDGPERLASGKPHAPLLLWFRPKPAGWRSSAR